MNRRIFLQVSSPAVLLGAVLVITCVACAVFIGYLQHRLIRTFRYNAASLRAAHEMEVAVRKLRYDSFVQLLQPGARSQSIHEDHAAFEASLERAEQLGPHTQGDLLDEIGRSFTQYQTELDQALKDPPNRSPRELLAWAEAHPIKQVVEPCQALLNANQEMMENNLRESESMVRQAQMVLLLLGTLGPLGGILSGYALARRLYRSITRLQVRVQDVHSHLSPEVDLIELRPGASLDSLHDVMDRVQQHVKALVEKLQVQQREMVRSEQLVIVGQMASSIAHEIRNPLTAIKWLVEDALQHPEGFGTEDLRVVQAEVRQMEKTVQGMLDFARPSSDSGLGTGSAERTNQLPTPSSALRAARAPCDLRDLVRQALELIRARKRQLGITCELDLPDRPALANVDPGQFKSVLANLFFNALDAMPHGGRLTVRLTHGGGRFPSPGAASPGLPIPQSSGLKLTVEDTGTGIPPEMLDRVFLPFTTTKATGTGLGLSVAKGVVEEHGGRLTAENRPEGGARFTVWLPTP
jgi:two-component system sensor histidine kinase HydH